MLYFCYHLYYSFLFLLSISTSLLFANLSMSMPSVGLPTDQDSSLSMPAPSLDMNSSDPSLSTPAEPSLPGMPSPSTIPTPAASLVPSASSTPAPTLPSLPAASAPSLLNATQEAPSLLAPVTVSPIAPITPITTTAASLGSGITSSVTPPGMNTQGPAVNLSSTPLTQTLHQLVNNTRSVFSIYDQETCNLLKNGSQQQKLSAALRPTTDASISASDFQKNPMTAGAQQVTATNKHKLPRAAHAMSKVSTMSFTRHKNKCTLPEALFNNSQLEYKYKLFINQLKKCSYFLPIFTKFHILALSQLYQYLIGIYVSLTMTHIDSLDSYIVLEQSYGLNNKALIVQYLVDLVEQQLNNALLELFPNLPKSFLVHSGLTTLQADHISRLDLLFVNMEQVVLATFGIRSIAPEQWKTILTILTNPLYSDERKSIDASELETVARKLSEYLASLVSSKTSFIDSLSKKQKNVLVNYLDILTEQFCGTQELEDCKSIGIMLATQQYSDFTQGEYTLLKNIISYYALTTPLEAAINTISSLHAKLNNQPLSETLNDSEFSFLQSLIAFIAISFERTSFDRAHQSITALEPIILKNQSALTPEELSLFNYYKNNSTYPKIMARSLARSLKNSPSLLAYLTEDQKKTLITGITDYKINTPSLSPANLSLLDQLTAAITRGGLSADDLIAEQKNIYDTAINFLVNYIPDPITEDGVIKELTKAFGQRFKDFITKPANLNNFNIKYISRFSPSQQVMLYCAIQSSFAVLQTKIDKHSREINNFKSFTLYRNDIEAPLFKGITYSNYQTLIALNTLLTTGTLQENEKNLDGINADQKKLLRFLCTLLVTPPSIKGKKPAVFQQIAATLSNNTQLNELVKVVEIPSTVNIDTLSQTFSSSNFFLASLSKDESRFLQQVLQEYEKLVLQSPSLNTPPSQTANKGLQSLRHPLSKDDDLTVSTILSILNSEMHLKDSQENMVQTLATVFDFFASYTATLHVTPSDSISVINKDFSQFAGYAAAIAQQLEKAAVGSSTPALFIYDKNTLEHLSFLPILAQQVESSSSLFLPTQAVDMALLTQPVPSTIVSASTNNQVILQKNVPYNIPSLLIADPKNPGSTFSPKFFFKDKDGRPFANEADLVFQELSPSAQNQSINHPRITWLTKTQMNLSATDKSPHYKYYATRPLEGQEGIYMNIPLISRDQGDHKNVLARLYEQKIIPQPEWLNSPEGVIGMIRACVGDFVTALELDETIFDPVINYLIRYTLVKSGSVPQDAGIPGNPSKLTLEYLQKSLATYQQLSQQELFATYVGPTTSPSSSTQGATT